MDARRDGLNKSELSYKQISRSETNLGFIQKG
jgi:hypothetical protein